MLFVVSSLVLALFVLVRKQNCDSRFALLSRDPELLQNASKFVLQVLYIGYFNPVNVFT